MEWVKWEIVHHTLYFLLTHLVRNEKRNKGAGGLTGKVTSGQNESHNTMLTCTESVWVTTGKEACGLVLGHVTLIQFVARDKDRRAHGLAVCERSKIAAVEGIVAPSSSTSF